MTAIATRVAALRLDPLPATAAVGGACGLLAGIGPLPAALKAALLLGFVAVGPGSALLQFWSAGVPPLAQRALVPVLGLAVVVLVVTGALLLGYWAPRVVLVALAAGTVATGVAGWWRGRSAP
jgi:hypothetical protein